MSETRAIDIRATDICKTFVSRGQKVEALRKINLQVETKTMCCIVGPSGCGKSTLLRILLGLDSPTSGEVWIDPERRKAGIAYVEQAALLLPWRTAIQNAALGNELRATVNASRLEHVVHLLDKYGLKGFENHLSDELSGGMRQRVAVIRALASEPKLLLCDEPFSSVDFVTRLELNTVFKYMCRVEGITTVFVTHNIEEALFLADSLVVMSGRPGRIVSTYTPRFSVGSEDAVKCRESPEFGKLFTQIWNDLKGKHAG